MRRFDNPAAFLAGIAFRTLAGPVAECIEALAELTGAILECERDDSKSLADTITAEIEQRACDALAALDTAKEPHQ